MSPHGVRIGGASGASLWIGCSSANRALAGKLLWDGIVAVPRVFDSGCPVLFSVEEHGQPGGSARSGDAGERDSRPGAPRLISLACGHIATHGGTQGVAESWTFGGYQSSANQLRPPGGRCIGSTGLAGSPRRPRIMEGPLVSDTTELLSGAPGASEDAPVGSPAPAAAAGGSAKGAPGATASTSKSRSRGGTGLSSLLMPELQKIAQTMGIPGAGRMRKGQLVEAIQAREGGTPRPDTSVANQGSDQRVASAGADSTRLRKQDAMGPDTRTQPGVGDGAASGLGASTHGGIGADGAGQQLSFDQSAVADRPNGRAQQAPAQPAEAQQAPAQPTEAQQAPGQLTEAQPTGTQQAGAQETAGAPQGAREDGQPGSRDEAAPGETQRGDRRRRNGRRDEQPSRGRDQATREQSGRDSGGRDQGSRDQSSREQSGREQSGRSPAGSRAAAITAAATVPAGTAPAATGAARSVAVATGSRWRPAAGPRARRTTTATDGAAAATGSGTGTAGATARPNRRP